MEGIVIVIYYVRADNIIKLLLFEIRFNLRELWEWTERENKK